MSEGNPDAFVQYQVIEDVCGKLDKSGLQYMLTGSMALNYYAQPRLTRDIDIVIDLEPGDERALARLFSADYFFDEDVAREAIAKRRMFNVAHLKTLFKIDFIVRKKSTFDHHGFCRRKRVEIDRISTWIISKEDLILSKMRWAKDSMSEKQLIDIKNLLQTGCDMGYVQQWIKTLQLEDVYAKAEKVSG